MEGSGSETTGPGTPMRRAGSRQGTAVLPNGRATLPRHEQATRERHLPPLLRSRPVGQQLLLAGAVPALFGALCGWVVGVHEVVYIILVVPLAIVGQVVAAFEHRGAREGAIRGVTGGTLFGGFIVIVHELTGEEAKAELPEPLIVLVAVTAIAGSLLGALGGHWREAAEREGRLLDLSLISPAELLGMGAAVVLFVSLWLPWFTTSAMNPNSTIAGASRGESAGAWQVFNTLDILLALACTAPFLLTWILARGHRLTWKPGEVTMVVGITAMVLILCNGVILGRPGDSVDIGLGVGYFVALVASASLLLAGYLRQAFYTEAHKPPGVI
jgi:hypothetical protein